MHAGSLVAYTIGWTEVLVVGAVILLLFSHRLPGAMRSLGRGVTEFKKGLKDSTDDDDRQDEPDKLEG
jgi:sec-independent protein translocase protein TatA